jgi:hypothetical protein
VEVLHVERSARHWRQFHERYSVLTAVRAGSEVAHRGRVRAVTTGDLLFLEAGEVHVNLRIHTPQTFDALCVDPPTWPRPPRSSARAARHPTGGTSSGAIRRRSLRSPASTARSPGGHHHWSARRGWPAASSVSSDTMQSCPLGSRPLPGLRPVEPRAAPSDRPPRHPAVRRARDYLAAHFR